MRELSEVREYTKDEEYKGHYAGLAYKGGTLNLLLEPATTPDGKKVPSQAVSECQKLMGREVELICGVREFKGAMYPSKFKAVKAIK